MDSGPVPISLPLPSIRLPTNLLSKFSTTVLLRRSPEYSTKLVLFCNKIWKFLLRSFKCIAINSGALESRTTGSPVPSFTFSDLTLVAWSWPCTGVCTPWKSAKRFCFLSFSWVLLLNIFSAHHWLSLICLA